MSEQEAVVIKIEPVKARPTFTIEYGDVPIIVSDPLDIPSSTFRELQNWFGLTMKVESLMKNEGRVSKALETSLMRATFEACDVFGAKVIQNEAVRLIWGDLPREAQLVIVGAAMKQWLVIQEARREEQVAQVKKQAVRKKNTKTGK